VKLAIVVSAFTITDVTSHHMISYHATSDVLRQLDAKFPRQFD